MKIFLTGFAEIDITPPKGVDLAGYAAPERKATGVHDPLKAVAVVFDDRKQKSIICSVDTCVMNPILVKAVRQRVAFQTAVREERVMILATHTHSGPILGGDSLINQQWLKIVEDRLVQVIVEADCMREPAEIGIASAYVGKVGKNRRNPKHGPADNQVNTVLCRGTRSGQFLGMIVNFSCHPTVLAMDNMRITADYPGEIRKYLSQHFPEKGPVLFINGACGDVNPGGYSPEDSALGKEIRNRTFEWSKKIGQLVGDNIIKSIEKIKLFNPEGIQSSEKNIEVPMKKMPLPAEAEIALREAERLLEKEKIIPSGKDLDQLKLNCIYASIKLNYARKAQAFPGGKAPIAVQVISFQNLAFIGFPGEIFCSIGNIIKEHSPFENTVIAAYANDYKGYFPCEDALGKDTYEYRVACFGPQAEALLVGWAEKLLKDAYQLLSAVPEKSVLPAVKVKPDLLVQEHHPQQAKFPAIDFHLHYWSRWQDFEEIAANMDRANIRYGVCMVGDAFPGALIKPVKNILGEFQERFLLFTGFDLRKIDEPEWGKYVHEKLAQDLVDGAVGIKIYKELGLKHVDQDGCLIMPDDPRLNPIWQAAAENRIPVLYHIADPPSFFDPITPENERYDQLKYLEKWQWSLPGHPSYEMLIHAMERLAGKNPATTFIFPHFASLSDNLTRCSELLINHPNVYVDVSARLPQLGRQPFTARRFFLEHSDRILFGTDDSWPGRGNIYPLWFRLLETEDEYFGGEYYGSTIPWACYGLNLPDDVLKKIYRGNAANLINITF
ncbi:MAG: hypothetical protein A2X48_13000 [Lentisphaerae bacterium GWF2_49_21]|nr:MAG: hypothetical protein A2X48_13000 [Lentisphaerae bacterium GWF2_49_21]